MKTFELSMDLLCSKDNEKAFAYLKELKNISLLSSDIYPYFDDFIMMLEDKRSFIRIRGFILIAVNARWDTDNKLDKIIDLYLRHIEDDKAFVVRQCIPYLTYIVAYKSHLVYLVLQALIYLDIRRYKESMQSLIKKDIEETIVQILQTIEISYCGLMCHFCKVRIATQTEDESLKQELAEGYSTEECQFIKEDMICNGCHHDIGINKKMCLECPIRSCSFNQTISHCGQCQNYPCSIIESYLPKDLEHRRLLDLLSKYYFL